METRMGARKGGFGVTKLQWVGNFVEVRKALSVLQISEGVSVEKNEPVSNALSTTIFIILLK